MLDKNHSLRKAFNEDGFFRANILYLKEFLSNSTSQDEQEIKLEQLAQFCGDRAAAVRFAKQLTRAEVARFIAGRHGHPSRLSWLYRPATIVNAACGDGQLVRLITSEATEPSVATPRDSDEDGRHSVVDTKVAELKAALARMHGVSPSNVEISFTVKK